MQGDVCVANIGPQGQRLRFRLGVAGLAGAALLLAAEWTLGLPPLIRLATAVLVFGGFSGIFQAREKT
jgi:hypothetical protein